MLFPLKCIGKQVLIPARDKNATVNMPEVASNFRRQGTAAFATSDTNVWRTPTNLQPDFGDGARAFAHRLADSLDRARTTTGGTTT